LVHDVNFLWLIGRLFFSFFSAITIAAKMETFPTIAWHFAMNRLAACKDSFLNLISFASAARGVFTPSRFYVSGAGFALRKNRTGNI
jgi:hypothetical protein